MSWRTIEPCRRALRRLEIAFLADAKRQFSTLALHAARAAREETALRFPDR